MKIPKVLRKLVLNAQFNCFCSLYACFSIAKNNLFHKFVPSNTLSFKAVKSSLISLLRVAFVSSVYIDSFNFILSSNIEINSKVLDDAINLCNEYFVDFGLFTCTIVLSGIFCKVSSSFTLFTL